MPHDPQPVRLLFVQTQAEMAGAQEISRLLGEALAERRDGAAPRYRIDHLFFYRKTLAFDHWPNAHFCLENRPQGPLAFAAFLAGLVRRIRALRPHVLLSFQHYGNIFAAPAARLAGVPVVVANHVSAPATVGRAARRIDRVLGVAGVYDTATVNSLATLEDFKGYPKRYAGRLVHVPHGFAEKRSSLSRKAARVSFALPPDVPLIGSVARLHPLKQLDAAIAVLSDRPALNLAIAGQGPDRERLQRVAAEAGVDGRVHFVGDLPPGRVGDFLAALDVFVFPSLAETFGLAAVEAARAGVPVVANDLPVLREVLSVDGVACALFAEAADPAAFGGSIDTLLGDRARAAALTAQASRLGERYSIAAMVAAYEAIIAAGLARHRVRPDGRRPEGHLPSRAPSP